MPFGEILNSNRPVPRSPWSSLSHKALRSFVAFLMPEAVRRACIEASPFE
jgi:hypothetical protein